MAKYENQVNYRITTTYNNAGLSQLMTQLNAVEAKFRKVSATDYIYGPTAYQQDMARIQKIKSLVSSSYNMAGQFSIAKFNKGLTTTGLTMKSIQDTLSRTGTVGQSAMHGLLGQMTMMNTTMKQTSVLSQKIINTLGNTVRWGIIAAGFQAVMSSVMDAANYVKELDESLTQITMVSGESRDNMKDFAKYANQAAAALGSATTDYTNAVKVFVQEGFNLEESKKQATQATILGNVSEQDTATTADQITAYRNAFQLSIEDMDGSLDKLANIANKTAANVSELMTAAQKSASTAASVGASEDSFLASIATIQSVTRESAENIGNGLKSIYTRFADLKTGGESSEGGESVTYGQYAQALKSVGVDILKEDNTVKTMDEILSELQAVWQTLDRTEKLAVGEKVAGRYQYNRFATLMENQAYYDKAYDATQTADGAMAQMQEDYMQGIEGSSQRLSTNIESIFTSIYNSGALEALVKSLADLSGIINNIVNIIDKGNPIFGNFGFIITGLIAAITKLGSKNIASGITNMVMNRRADKETAIDDAAKMQMSKMGLKGMGLDTSKINPLTQQMATTNMRFNELKPYMTAAQIEETAEAMKTWVMVTQEAIDAGSRYSEVCEAIAAADELLGVGLVEDTQNYKQQQEVIQRSINIIDQHNTNINKAREELSKLNIALETNTTMNEASKAAVEQKVAALEKLITAEQEQVDAAQKDIEIAEKESQRLRKLALEGQNLGSVFRELKNAGNGNFKGLETALSQQTNLPNLISNLSLLTGHLSKLNEMYIKFENVDDIENKVTAATEKLANATKEQAAAEEKATAAREQLNALQKDGSVSVQELHAAERKLYEAEKMSSEALENLNAAIQEHKSITKAATTSQEDFIKEGQRTVEILREQAAIFGENTAEGRKYSILADSLSKKLEKLATTGKLTQQEQKALSKILEIVSSSTSQLEGQFDSLIETLRKMGPQFNKLAEELERTKLAAMEAANGVNALEDRLNLSASIAKVGNALNSFSMGLMSVMMLGSAVKDMFETLSNAEATSGEKLEALGNGIVMITMSLGMLLPMLGKVNATTIKNSLISASNTSAKILNWIATKLKTKATEQEIIVEEAEAAASGKTASANILASTATFIRTAMTKELTVALQGLIATEGAAAAGLGPLIILILGVVAAIAAAVAVVKLISLGITSFVNAVNASEVALEKETKTLNTFKEQLSNAKDNLSNFNEKLDNIKSNSDAFDGLTKGTKEYSEALIKSNQDTLDFIDTYKSYLEGYTGNIYSTGTYGEQTISQDALDYIEKNINNDYLVALSSQYAQQAKVDKIQAQIDQEQEINKIHQQSTEERSNYNLAAVGSTALEGAALGAMLGAETGPGAAITGVIGGAIGLMAGSAMAVLDSANYEAELAKKDLEIGQKLYQNNIKTSDYLNKNNEANVDEFKSTLEKLGVDLTGYTDTYLEEIIKCGGAIETLGASASLAAQQQEAYAQQIGASLVQDNVTYTGDGSNQAVVQRAEAILGGKTLENGEYYNQARGSFITESYDENGSLVATEKAVDDKERQAYAKTRNWTYKNGKYLNSEGKAVDEEVSDTDVRKYSISSKAIEMASKESAQNDIYNKVEKSYNNLAKSGLTKSAVDDIVTSKGVNTDTALSSQIDLTKLSTMSAQELSAEDLITLGFDIDPNTENTGEQLANQLKAQLEAQGFKFENGSYVAEIDIKKADANVKQNTNLYDENGKETDLGEEFNQAVNQYATNEDGTLNNQLVAKIKLAVDKDASEEEIKAAIDAMKENESLDLVIGELKPKSDDTIINSLENLGGESSDILELADQLQECAEQSDELADSLDHDREAAINAANASLRMEKGIAAASESMEDWQKVLTKENRTLPSYTKNMKAAKEAVADIMNVDASDLSDGFIEAALASGDLEEAINGSDDALKRLQKAALESDFSKLNIDTSAVEESLNNVGYDLDSLVNESYDIEVGTSLDDSGMYNGLQALVDATATTAEQAEELLSEIGWNPEVEMQQVEVTGTTGSAGDGTINYSYPDPSDPSHTITGTLPWRANTDIKSGQTITIPIINGKSTTKAAPKISSIGGGGSSSGGGGGGGGSAKTLKAKTKEYDRYERVNNKLDKNAARYDKISQAQERLSGNNLTKNLLEQNKLLEEQVALQKEKYNIQLQERDELRNELTGYGITFDEDGIINNWKSIIDRMNAEGEAIAAGGDEDALSDWEERFDKIEKAYERWNELDDEIIENETTQRDLMNQIKDKVIEAYTEVLSLANSFQELRDSMRDLASEWAKALATDTREFRITKSLESISDLLYYNKTLANELSASFTTLGDSLKETDVKSKALLNTLAATISEDKSPIETALQSVKQIQAGYELLQEGKSFTLGGQTFTPEDINSVREMLEGLTDLAQTTIEKLNDQIETYTSEIIDSVSEVTDEIDKQAERFERVNAHIEYYADVLEMMYGENASKQIAELNRLEVQNLVNTAQFYLETIPKLQAVNEELVAARDNYEEGSTKWLELTEKITENEELILDYQDQYNEALQKQIELLKQATEYQVRGETSDFLKQVLGEDYQYSIKQWELLNEQATDYVDAVNQAYQIQKLEGKYKDLLDKADTVSTQKKINEQMSSELSMLREKDKLSEYDIEYANAKLNLLEKQIALEDAQNNKSKMRLKRDSQGNYTYQYVADEDAIKSAQEEALDAWNNLYNISRDRSVEIKDMVINASNELQDKIAEIATSTAYTVEQKAELIQLVIDNYNAIVEESSEQTQKNLSDLTEAANGLIFNISENNKQAVMTMLGESKTFTDQNLGYISNAYNKHVQGWAGNIKNYVENGQKQAETLKVSLVKCITDLDEALKTTKENIDKALGGDSEEGGTGGLKKQLTDAQKEVDNLDNKFAYLLRDGGPLDQFVDYISQIAEQLGLIDEAIEIAQTQRSLGGEGVEYVEPEPEQSSSNSSSSSGSGGGGVDHDTAVNLAYEIWYGYWGNDPYRHNAIAAAYGEDMAVAAQNAVNDIFYGWYTGAYDTGGYTGDWSDITPDNKNGKLAILHQKELVLNAADTENILEAVNIVRGMMNSMKTQTYGDMLSQMASMFTMPSQKEEIEQNITINADFSAVESAIEIKQALEGLADRASQYAFRKTK